MKSSISTLLYLNKKKTVIKKITANKENQISFLGGVFRGSDSIYFALFEAMRLKLLPIYLWAHGEKTDGWVSIFCMWK